MNVKYNLKPRVLAIYQYFFATGNVNVVPLLHGDREQKTREKDTEQFYAVCLFIITFVYPQIKSILPRKVITITLFAVYNMGHQITTTKLTVDGNDVKNKGKAINLWHIIILPTTCHLGCALLSYIFILH